MTDRQRADATLTAYIKGHPDREQPYLLALVRGTRAQEVCRMCPTHGIGIREAGEVGGDYRARPECTRECLRETVRLPDPARFTLTRADSPVYV